MAARDVTALLLQKSGRNQVWPSPKDHALDLFFLFKFFYLQVFSLYISASASCDIVEDIEPNLLY